MTIDQFSWRFFISPRHWLCYAIGTLGILFSIALCYMVKYEPLAAFHFVFKPLLPWILLALGVSLSTLFVLALLLIQLVHLRSHSLELIGQHIEKEIANRIDAEEGKQELEKALLQGQKLQAIGTLAGGIAHDFNNILYAIIGYAEISREDLPKESPIYENLGKVLEAAIRGKELVARILTFSRRPQQEFTLICLKEGIESILALIRPAIPSSVLLTFHIAPGNYSIMGNKTQLHQVIVNIINNAVDAMDGEGMIHIQLEKLPVEKKYLKQFPNLTKNISYYKIDIMDTGHGMDRTTMERVFEPFFTTKEVGKGTGLGLATAHTIIEQHHGEISVKSQLGQGTTFTILLPECTKEI